MNDVFLIMWWACFVPHAFTVVLEWLKVLSTDETMLEDKQTKAPVEIVPQLLHFQL